MDDWIKTPLRLLATCDHPREAVIMSDGRSLWCSVCGAFREHDAKGDWLLPACATHIRDALVERALQDPANEAAKKAISAMED